MWVIVGKKGGGQGEGGIKGAEDSGRTRGGGGGEESAMERSAHE